MENNTRDLSKSMSQVDEKFHKEILELLKYIEGTCEIGIKLIIIFLKWN